LSDGVMLKIWPIIETLSTKQAKATSAASLVKYPVASRPCIQTVRPRLPSALVIRMATCAASEKRPQNW
jgi:hypothetical protein